MFGELTSVTSNKRMTTGIIFAGATPIKHHRGAHTDYGR